MAQFPLRRYDSDDTRQKTFRVYELSTRKGGFVLQQVLEWGTLGRRPGQPFDEYLISVKNIPRSKFKKVFNQSQRRKMQSDPNLGHFDTSLLYVCIQLGCEGLAPQGDSRWTDLNDTVECHVTAIKNFRNNFLHEEFRIDSTNYLDKINELRTILNKAIEKAGELYNIDEVIVRRMCDELNDDINRIRDEPLDVSLRSSLDFDCLRQLVKVEGIRELRAKYRGMSSISPASKLWDNLKVRVDKIYTKILMKEEGDNGQGELVDFEELLELIEKRQGNKDSSVLLVEGPPGVGKTTLTRKIISDWASGTSNMRTLTDYDYVILTDCRDREIHSLFELLNSLMSSVSKKVQKEHLVECIQQNKLLFIVDGLDELNSSSEQVLKDILKMAETDDITVLCTTRPNKVPDFKRYVPDNFSIFHLKVIGIHESDRDVFVTNYCKALDSNGEKTDISGLLRLLRRKQSRLQDHWRLPFNLVLVTILWFRDPESVNSMTTATELYTKTNELCTKKLIHRLLDHEKTRHLEFIDLHKKVGKFLKKLYKEALMNHHSDNTVLSADSLERLRDTCQLFQLPHAEVMSAFLIHTASLTDESVRNSSFPHKGLQDFYSAMHVRDVLLSDELNIPRILSGFEVVLSDNSVPADTCQIIVRKNYDMLRELDQKASKTPRTIRSVLAETIKESAMHNPENNSIKLDLVKIQNIMIHLVGLLYLGGRAVKPSISSELVALLRETGIADRSQWLDILLEVKCEARISKCISGVMNLKGDIKIVDSHVAGYASVLSYAQPSSLSIELTSDPQDIPRLSDLLMAVPKEVNAVRLCFHHDFRNPTDKSCELDGPIQNLFRRIRSRAFRFKGHLSGTSMSHLPKSLRELMVTVVADSHYHVLQPSLSQLTSQWPNLRWLVLNIGPEVSESVLQPLLNVNNVSLIFVNIGRENIPWVCNVTRALQPTSGNGFLQLMFPGVGKCHTTCIDLASGLGKAGVKVRKAILVSPAVAHLPKLRVAVRKALGCAFHAQTDDELWQFWTTPEFSIP